jgi:hypothetical protein
MKIEQLLSDLSSPSEQNEALKLLEDIIVDTDPLLIQSLTRIISAPESIENTNKFASLLADLPSEDYISPLIDVISRGEPGKALWLADYMYALGTLLMDRDDYLPADENFVHLLGKWLLTTGGGEISWKSGVILANLEHPTTREYLIKGAADINLFHQTRIACIHGLVGQYLDDGVTLLQTLRDDPEPEVKEYVTYSLEYIRNKGASKT